MTKVKVSPDEPQATTPPMPGSGGPEASSFPSTSSEAPSPELGVAVVDEKLAAELINLPYEAWAIFEKRIPRDEIILSENMKQFLGGPVSRVLTKYGLGKIAKDEVVVIVTLSAHTFAVVSALRKAPKEDVIPEEAK